MPITLTMSPINLDGSASNFIYAIVQVAFSGSYSTGGDTVDFTQIADKLSGSQIIQVFAESNSATDSSFGTAGGYYTMKGNAQITPGQTSPVPTLLNAWKIKLFNSGGTEFSAGAYSAAVLSDVVTISLTLRKLL
jgi:hypothetical protein